MSVLIIETDEILRATVQSDQPVPVWDSATDTEPFPLTVSAATIPPDAVFLTPLGDTAWLVMGGSWTRFTQWMRGPLLHAITADPALADEDRYSLLLDALLPTLPPDVAWPITPRRLGEPGRDGGRHVDDWADSTVEWLETLPGIHVEDDYRATLTPQVGLEATLTGVQR